MLGGNDPGDGTGQDPLEEPMSTDHGADVAKTPVEDRGTVSAEADTPNGERIEVDEAGSLQRISSRADSVAERFGKSDWIELASAVLLALAAIASAWSAYQANSWGGVQASAFAGANAARTESVRNSNTAMAQRQVDVATFIAFLQAYAARNQNLVDFYEARFRDEFKPAFQSWLSSVPSGSVPPGTPFAESNYVLAAQEQADALLTEAQEQSAVAQSANQTGNNFVIVIVIMAMVLFFAGVGTKFRQQGVRRLMIAISAVLFVAGTIVIISLPQNVGFVGG
jgi:hypothetical protein